MAALAKPFALVPARGGSKRLPRKNVLPLGGKPLLAWTIESALASEVFDDVVVSSEDEEILGVAEQYGATPLPRDPQYAGDRVESAELCRHVLRQRFPDENWPPALYLLLPTSPFRRPESIRAAWELFVREDAAALMSVVGEYPAQWMLTSAGNGRLAPLFPDQYGGSRVDLPPSLRHDGSHAIARLPDFLDAQQMVHLEPLAYDVEPIEAVDVDDALDLAFAEFLLESGRSSGGTS